MNTKLLLRKLATFFPKRFAKMNHDRVGLMTGSLKDETKSIALCLDLDDSIFETIKEIKPDLVITHHPFIFGTKAKVFKYDLLKKELSDKMDEIGVPVYSFHTNFDTGKNGMNDALANAIGLTNIYAPNEDIMMRIGTLDVEMDVLEFAIKAKESFNVEYGLLINEGKKTIKKVGIIGGGGSRRYDIALKEGCDIYISGDAPHYVRRDIVNKHYNYLDFPHEIEKIFMPQMKKILKDIDPTLEITIIDHEKLPKVI